MSASPYVFDVTQADFETKVLAASGTTPVLVDFWAPWCAPCRALAPVLDKLAAEHKGKLLVAKVNTDEEMQVASLFGIRSLPTVVLIRNGRPVDGFMGAQPEAVIREFLAQHLGEAAPEAEAEEELPEELPSPDLDQRIAELERRIAAEPDKHELKLDLAEAIATTGDVDRTEKLLNQLPPNLTDDPRARRVRSRLAFLHATNGAPSLAALDAELRRAPTDLRARHQFGSRLLLDGAWPEALEQFLTIMQSDRKFDDDLGRRALLQAFDLVEDQDLVSRTRRRMAAMIF
jgi:putative thioredoxin